MLTFLFFRVLLFCVLLFCVLLFCVLLFCVLPFDGIFLRTLLRFLFVLFFLLNLLPPPPGTFGFGFGGVGGGGPGERSCGRETAGLGAVAGTGRGGVPGRGRCDRCGMGGSGIMLKLVLLNCSS